jgi:ribosomal protein S6
VDTNPEQVIDNEQKTYELGYLLSPFLPEEGIEEAVGRIFKATIESFGGTVTTSPAPRMRKLAYTISILRGPKQGAYSDAYFGALRFQASGEAIKKISDALDKTQEVVRFIVLALPKNVGPMTLKHTAPARMTTTPNPVAEDVAPKEKPELSEADIDKEIEGLLSTNI